MNIELLIADMRAAVARGSGFNLSKRERYKLVVCRRHVSEISPLGSPAVAA